LTSVGENFADFRTFATDRKQVDFGREKEFSRWFWFKGIERQTDGFGPEKQARKGFPTV
jgi:hypothetical protein